MAVKQVVTSGAVWSQTNTSHSTFTEKKIRSFYLIILSLIRIQAEVEISISTGYCFFPCVHVYAVVEELHKLCSSRSLNVISYRNKIPVFKIKSHVICNIETLQVNLLLYLFRVLVKAYNGFSQHFFLQCIHIVQLPSALFDAGSGNSILPSDWLIGKSTSCCCMSQIFYLKKNILCHQP